ncbi:uncharacterized protein LOC117572054 [Drosophila albomicans]|uniref:Uncharacterized protein LOC117572054 n=1 Tax=Drosophila albomicans TaxID=7291 RepID=A0A6P8X2Y0_DROAB|nr:uncharacterized protein LOC117572054 [Drosophila albomicans]
MQRRFFVCGILLIWISYNESVVFKFTNAVCESYNKSWIIINQCRLRAINRNKTVFNLRVTALHPIEKAMVEFQVFKRENGYKPWLVKTSWDACLFLKRAYNPFAIMLYRMFRDFTNINHTCPFVGDLIVKGCYLRPELLGLVLPTGDYLVATSWFTENKKFLIINAHFKFTEDL